MIYNFLMMQKKIPNINFKLLTQQVFIYFYFKDDLEYIEFENNDELEINFNIYENLLNKRRQTLRVKDLKNGRNYILKTITPVDDVEMKSVLQEIVLNIFLAYSQHFQLAFHCFDNDLDTDEDVFESSMTCGQNYLESLYNQSIKDVKYSLSGLYLMKDCFMVKKGEFMSFFLIFEDYDFTLKDYLLRCQKVNASNAIDESVMLSYLLSLNLQKLKKNGICHNNIAPENILIQKRVLNFHQTKILISNFEQSVIFGTRRFDKNIEMTFEKNEKNMKYKGPEIINKMDQTKQKRESILCSPFYSDIYSLGCLLTEIRIHQIIPPHKLPDIVQSFSFIDQSQQVILFMLNNNPHQRYKYSKIIESWDKLFNRSKISIETLDNLFRYDYLESNDELNEDLILINQIRGTRRLQMYDQCIKQLTPLQNKYKEEDSTHPKILILQNSIDMEIGNFYRDQGDHKNAKKYYQNCIDRILGDTTTDIFISRLSDNNTKEIFNMIKILLNCAIQDNYNIDMIKNCLLLYKKCMDRQNPKVMRLMISLGEAQEKIQDFQNAMITYQELALILSQSMGFKGSTGIRLLEKLASIFFYQSEYSNALAFFQKSLGIKQELFFRQNVTISETYLNCGECYRQLGSYSLAVEMYEKAVKQVWSQRQSKYEIIALIYNNMGLCYKARGLKKQALKLYEESYNIRCNQFGVSHPVSLETLMNIAVLHVIFLQKFNHYKDELGQVTKAISFYDEISSTMQESIPDFESFPLYAEVLQNKGISYFNLAHYNKATSNLNDALAIKKKIYGNIHLSVANTLQNCALVLHRQGQYRKSLQLYDEAIKIYHRKVGNSHYLVKQIQQNKLHTQKFAK